jgi:hypothetical protein
MLRHRGCRAEAGLVPLDQWGVAEAAWNGPPQRVRVPYAKHAHDEWLRYLSTAGHVKPRRNLGGPPSKATYSSVTDSAPVP